MYVPAVHQLRVVGAGTGGGLAAAVTKAASGVDAGAATPGLARPASRLACYDRLAETRAPAVIAPEPVAGSGLVAGRTRRCDTSAVTELSGHWELEPDSDCGTFGIRGYRPISLSWIGSDSVNTAPSSPTPSSARTVATVGRATARGCRA